MEKIIRHFQNKEFLILNGSLITFVLAVVFISPLHPSDDILLHLTDSLTYYSAGADFFDFSQQGHSWIRPFLYSCFLKYGHSIGGAWLIVIFQLFFWLVAGNFIFYSIKNISNRLLTRIIAVSIFAVNISLISYIFHGMTEVLSTTLLSAIAYLITKSIKIGPDIKNTLYIIFLFALLTVTKPLFQYPFILSLVVGIIVHLKSFFMNPKLILRLLFFISPVLLQYSAMYSKYGKLKISAIGEQTFDLYILAQGIREVENISDIIESQHVAHKMTSEEKSNYLWEHKDVYVNLYFKNLKDNITGYGTNIILPEKYNITHFSNFMTIYNNLNYILFILFLLAFIILFIVDLFSGKLIRYWPQIILGSLLYYIIFSSGISFWQADRLVLFSLPLWIILYTQILTRIYTIISSRSLVQK